MLSLVRDNLQPVDHAEFRKLFAGIAQIISDTRREALRSDSDSAEKLLRDLDKFERLADAYERGIFKLIAEAQGAE